MASTDSSYRSKFLEFTARHRPVDATFIGLSRGNHRLPDLSPAGRSDLESDLSQLLELLSESETDAPSSDRQALRGQLEIQRWELESGHYWKRNPSFYTGEAIFAILSLFLSSVRPLPNRFEMAEARMRSIPGFLQEALQNLECCPAAWLKRAQRECSGALHFFDAGIPLLAREIETGTSSFLEAAAIARNGFESFSGQLQSLQEPGQAGYGCGEEGLELLLQKGHFLDLLGFDGNSILAYAEEQRKEARAAFDAGLNQLGFQDPSGFQAALRELHPARHDYYRRYQEIWDQVRDLACFQDLLTWPDFPIRFVPRPDWARAAAPYLYFLFYRSPAAFGHQAPHDYLVEPIEGLSGAEQQKVLENHNDSVIKLNHVIHHGSIGHHVQNWHALRSESLVGQIAAVDCASRIALYCGGTMAEGWACYATDLMKEADFLSEQETLAELHSRVRMCCRAIVDVSLHQGRMTLQQAIDFYQTEAGMAEGAARGEAVKNSLFPGTGLMYLMGTDSIHRLRREVKERQGEEFSLKKFHDRFLSFGSLPVALVREEML